MPFTPSHMAAALPFVRTPLLPAAVAIGSMAPDVPYFVPVGVPRHLTHTPTGVVTIDLAMTLVLVLLWYAALRAPAVDLSPRPIRERMPRLGPLGWRRPGRGWVVSVMVLLGSAIVGILTHLAWDSFTHDGWLTDAWPVLQSRLGPLPLYKWLQHASTIAGLSVLAVWAAIWVRRTPPVGAADDLHAQDGSGAVGRSVSGPVQIFSARSRLAAWIAVVVAFGAGGFIPWMLGISAGMAPFDAGLVFRGATVAGGVAGLVGFVICGLWWIARARRQ